MRRKTKSLLILLTFAFGIMLASTISAASFVVFAQKNQTTTNVTPAGKQATKIINQTSIPANQTTTTIQKKAEPVGTVPLPSNKTVLSPPGSQAKLPAVSNKTTVTPTGKATTTIINQTSTPLNVTSTNATTATKQPQTAPSATNQTAASSAGSTNQTAANQQQANNTANPLAKVPVIGKLFGGK
jgi:cytoskeletal protein RodZ